MPAGTLETLLFLPDDDRRTRSVKLTRNVRVTADYKGDYRRLMVNIKSEGQWREMHLITSGNLIFSRLSEHLEEACMQAALDIDSGLQANEHLKRLAAAYDPQKHTKEALAVEIKHSLPMQNWIAHVIPAMQWPINFKDLFNRFSDDGRNLHLAPLDAKRLQTVEVWPYLKVLLEDKGHFARLSLYCYKRKGCVHQVVLATSLDTNRTKAGNRLREAIEHFRSWGGVVPQSVVDRIPIDQWVDSLSLSATTPVCPDEPVCVLQTTPTRGQERVNALARWALSPNVLLAFDERIDRPALFIVTRNKYSQGRHERYRIGSVPVKNIREARSRVIEAIHFDLSTLKACQGEYEPIAANLNRSQGQDVPTKSEIGRTLDALGFAGMVTFYDKAVLSRRVNGHRKRLYPEYDEQMRWICEAGPSSHTANLDCWWVLFGTTRRGRGKLFPWGNNRLLALGKAKLWRDSVESDD